MDLQKCGQKYTLLPFGVPVMEQVVSTLASSRKQLDIYMKTYLTAITDSLLSVAIVFLGILMNYF